MTDSKQIEAAATVQVPSDKKTLKEAVLEGLEEKGRGKDLWLWLV